MDSNADGNHIALADLRIAELMPFVSYDYERFALSSLESFQQAAERAGTPNAVCWVLLQSYYAAFFAAHALMRACGEAFVKLEKPQTEVLQTSSDAALTQSVAIEPAMYSLRIAQTVSGGISADLKKVPSKFGAHEGFWRVFDEFLSRFASQAVGRHDPEAHLVVAGVAEYQRFLRPLGPWRSSWLSAVRNEINYQHKHGVWRPRSLDKRTEATVASISIAPSSTVRLDYSPMTETISAFASAARYLATLNVEVGDVVAANATAARCFGSLWRRSRADARRT
ncbi:MAG: hypothetical protein IOC90_14520 [Methylocystis sp.]|nr:hypothetical protein [Methylocystis sp.]MCA3589228.1 hypothetical protein [Methylocystis sp.]MCA3593516.1 hypothetical protein [Methylocystis sp.]